MGRSGKNEAETLHDVPEVSQFYPHALLLREEEGLLLERLQAEGIPTTPSRMIQLPYPISAATRIAKSRSCST